MDLTAARIVEELLDPLMFSDLADESPSIAIRRLDGNTIELDFGDPNRVFLLTVEDRARA